MKYKFILATMIILLSLTIVSADFPITHYASIEKVLNKNIQSNSFTACKNNPDNCQAGSILTDFSVNFYFTHFKRYAVTHASSFCIANIQNANTDAERACSQGSCIHLAQDFRSHTKGVPYCIENTFIPNVVVHPFCEQKIDTWVVKNIPGIKERADIPLSAFEPCKDLFKRTLQGNEEFAGIDLDVFMNKLILEVQTTKTGYDTSFNNIRAIPLVALIFYVSFMLFFLAVPILTFFIFRSRKQKWKTFNYIINGIFLFIGIFLLILFIANLGGKAFSTFNFMVRPISALTPQYASEEAIFQESVDRLTDYFIQGESYLFGIDASGFRPLQEADKKIQVPAIILLTLSTLLFIILVFVNFRRPKRK